MPGAALNMEGGLSAWLRGVPLLWHNPVQIAAILLAFVAILLPKVREPLAGWIARARQPSPSDARKTAVAIGIVVFLYVTATAYWQGRELSPTGHDVHMYLLQARFLSTGRLWTAAHPMADFFETFYVFTKPVYAPMYFPGTALFYLPWAWFGIPAWLIAAAIGATAAALMYRVVGELLDGAAGIVAALLVPTIQMFRLNTIEPLSHTAMLMLGLLTTWMWLSWRRTSRSPAMAAFVGAAMGWALITRPLDALCYVLPIGVAMLLDLRGHSGWIRVLGAGCTWRRTPARAARYSQCRRRRLAAQDAGSARRGARIPGLQLHGLHHRSAERGAGVVTSGEARSLCPDDSPDHGRASLG